jgi:hypothetical protein
MKTKRSPLGLIGPVSALILASACFPGAVPARGDVGPVERYEREDRREEREYVPEYREYRPEPRTVYIIIRECPIRRLVYAAPVGGYYCIEDGRRVVVREPCYTSLPPRYLSYGYGYRGRIGAPHRY